MSYSRPQAPDDALRPELVDYERGGVALNDASQGLLTDTWRVRYAGGDVLISKAPYSVETVLVNTPDITELSLSFDQNMNPVLAYVAAGVMKLRWFDATVPGIVTTTFAGNRKPFVTMDDKRGFANAYNDVLLFYIRTNKLYYRQQRDRYATEYLLRTFPGPRINIRRLGMNEIFKLQVEIYGADAGSST